MNTGIITSFIIGGILLLAIVGMNVNISRSTTGLTMRGISQQNANTIGELLNNDIPKIGYDEFSKIDPAILQADSNKLVFKSNLEQNGIKDITWFFDTSTPVTSGSNPDDYVLYRVVGANQIELKSGVESFKFSYYEDNNLNPLSTPVADPSVIRRIKIELVVSSKEKLGSIGPGDGEYIISAWEKTFSPKNLNN